MQIKPFITFVFLAVFASAWINAQAAEHPAYLRALTDLRDARWNLERRPGDAAVTADEEIAIAQIDKAIAGAKKAALKDGKDIDYHPPKDAMTDYHGRLHNALELLRKAKSDVEQEEDNAEARGVRKHVLEHIDTAIDANKRAIEMVEKHR